ncbi:MAG: CRISPR system precrRNA processing endoribonuclease RAMP protein Cas6 [Chloroflexi bacterium]|nr:MAG: CRISPR system precrRNA processing endoribonuclease RAMP protein Cas6 [Chloroflexota bacterium]
MNLRLVHLRFDCVATTPIGLGYHYAGNNLRNALANVMRRATCSQARSNLPPTPEHAAVCPACWLLSAELDPGLPTRGYTIVPPIPPRKRVEAGESFSFGLTLVGELLPFLPYFVLAVVEIGRRDGVGWNRYEGWGRFEVRSIVAAQPLAQKMQLIRRPDEMVVAVPDIALDWTAVQEAADYYEHQIAPSGQLTIQFLSPVRLIEKENKQLFRIPDFGVFFQRLLFRIDQLGQQFYGMAKRNPEEVKMLHRLAEQVRLVDMDVSWHELWSNSSRKKKRTPFGGFTGTAVYWANDWKPLLPWLILGQATQVGKLTTKGNGVYQLSIPGVTPFWQWMETAEKVRI